MTRQWPLFASDSHRFYDWILIGVLLEVFVLCTLVYRWPTMIAISAHVTDSPDTITLHVITCPPMTRRWRHSHRFNRPSQFNHFFITSMSITSTTGQWEENFYWKNYSLNCLVFVKLKSGMSSGVLAISSFECMYSYLIFFSFEFESELWPFIQLILSSLLLDTNLLLLFKTNLYLSF
jgi:hypothetical protein